MKKVIILGLYLAAFAGCKQEERTDVKNTANTEKTGTLAPITDEVLETSVIYEANIRQYSPEGTFNAFTKDIPRLKKMGVKVLWLMPIYPISMKNRKSTDGRTVTDIKDPKERAKYLGSYYAISDYTAINPDLGTLEDFQKVVKTAHDNGMYVILDWVANHTGWDHKWITEHPEYYHKNAKGEVTDPLNPETGKSWGWTDVAHLDYGNRKLYDVMKDEMLYWVKEQNIDGFRCDVADNVPTEFWEYTVPKLEAVKPLFMLMESDKEYLFKKSFDMGYGWQAHHVMNDIAAGKKTVKDWDNLMVKLDSTYSEDDIFMNFTSNHDENSWNKSEYQRMGGGVELFAALTYLTPGMPLIYTGQEYGLDRSLKFFEKDSIPKARGKMYGVYEKLGALKIKDNALNGGKKPAAYKRLSTSQDAKVLAFERNKGSDKVVFVGNLSKTTVEFTAPVEGEFTDYMAGKKVNIGINQKFILKPWEYKILIK